MAIEQTVDSSLLQVNSNVYQSFLWHPKFKEKIVAVKSARCTVYYPKQKDEPGELILGPVLLKEITPGCYKLTFNTNNWKIGYYKAIFSGEYVDDEGEHLVVKEVSFELLAVDRLQYLIQQLVANLMDYPAMYQLDREIASGKSAQYWSNQDYFLFLKRALDRINFVPPTVTSFVFDDLPDEAEDILIEGGQAYALNARGRIEAANKLVYSDGISLTIDRVGYYQAESARLSAQFDKDIRIWKFNYCRDRLGLRWIRKMRVPYHFRFLAFHPLFKNIF